MRKEGIQTRKRKSKKSKSPKKDDLNEQQTTTTSNCLQFEYSNKIDKASISSSPRIDNANAFVKGSKDQKSSKPNGATAKHQKPISSSPMSTISSNLKLHNFNGIDTNGYFAEQQQYFGNQYPSQLGQQCYYYPTPESSPDVHYQLVNSDLIPTAVSSASALSAATPSTAIGQASTINVFITANGSNNNKTNKRPLDLPLNYPTSAYDYAATVPNPSVYQLQHQQQQQQLQHHHHHPVYTQFGSGANDFAHNSQSPMQNYRFNPSGPSANSYMFENYTPAATLDKDQSMFPLRT
jgi:hypothetical protein